MWEGIRECGKSSTYEDLSGTVEINPGRTGIWSGSSRIKRDPHLAFGERGAKHLQMSKNSDRRTERVCRCLTVGRFIAMKRTEPAHRQVEGMKSGRNVNQNAGAKSEGWRIAERKRRCPGSMKIMRKERSHRQLRKCYWFCNDFASPQPNRMGPPS